MKRCVSAVLCGTLLMFATVFCSSQARADSFSLTGGTVTLTIASQNNAVIGADVHGLAGAQVFDDSANSLGFIGIGNTTSPFGNNLLFSFNFPAFTESVVVPLDYSQMLIAPPTVLVPGIGAPLSGPITDPALISTLGTLRFGFVYTGFSVDPTTGFLLTTWDLSSIQAVPEPATLALFAGGLLGLPAVWRRKRK